MLSDDLAVADVVHGQVIAHSICPDIFLWRNSLEKLKVDGYLTKYHDAHRIGFSLPGKFDEATRSIAAIIQLGVHSESKISVVNIEGMSRFAAIGAMLYNSRIADALFNRVVYLNKVAAIAQKIPICRVWRPRGRWSVGELADIVISTVEKTL
jgi:hypothetical protein